MKKALVVLVMGICAIAMLRPCSAQVETWKIDMADPTTFLADGTVYIARDTSGYLVFKDSANDEKTLAELVGSAGVSAHSGLTGLANDDHTQYYTSGRLYSKLGSANSGTGANYVNSLPISGDVDGKTSIGAHVADAAIHANAGHRARVDALRGQYVTIQSAITALSGTGGVVEVSPGTYAERIEMTSGVVIEGAPGAIMTYGDVYPPAVKVPTGATGCVIRGMTIRSTNTSSGYQVIDVNATSDLILENCDIDGSSSYGNTKTISVAGTCYIRNSRIWSQREPVYITGTCYIEQSRIWATETSSSYPVIYSTGADVQLRNCWIDGGGGRYGLEVDNGACRLWGCVFQRCTEDIYRVGGYVYVGGSIYEAETGTVTHENEGYKKVREMSVDRAARGTSNPLEYRVSGEGLMFAAYPNGDFFTSGTVYAGSIDYEIANFGGVHIEENNISVHQPDDGEPYEGLNFTSMITFQGALNILDGITGIGDIVLDGYNVDAHQIFTEGTKRIDENGTITNCSISGGQVSGAVASADNADTVDACHASAFEKRTSGTLSVSSDGKKDYTTIQAAINAAVAGDTVMVFPGVYSEQITITKSNIRLVGVGIQGAALGESENAGAIITYASSGTGNDLMTIWIKSGGASALTGITLENLVVINSAALGTGIAQEALDIGRGDTYASAKHKVLIKNCSFYGEQDVVFINTAGNVIYDGCYFNGHSDVVSVADNCNFRRCFFENHEATGGDCLWVGRSGGTAFTVYLDGCYFKTAWTHTTSGGIGRFGESGTTIYLLHCIYPQAGTASVWNANGYTGTAYIYKTNGTFYSSGLNVTTLKDNRGEFGSLASGNIDSTGYISVDGASTLKGAIETRGNNVFKAYITGVLKSCLKWENNNGGGYEGGALMASGDDGANWDSLIQRTGVGEWTVGSYVKTSLIIPETMSATTTAQGEVVTKTAGENLVFGDVVYFKSDGKIWKANASAASTAPGLGMAIATINTSSSGKILLKGTVRNDSGYNWTVGGMLYLSTSAGAMTQTAPSGTDQVIQVLGICHPNADTVYFNPSLDYATHN